MKLNIHPDYKLGKVTCSCGNIFYVASTIGDQNIEICSACHPFYTGKQKLVDTAGRIEKFKKKYSVKFDLLADEDKKVSTLYNMLHPETSSTLTVRSVFIIDPNKKIRLTLTYPAATGRNFDELLRVIDSLQLTDHYQVATPANWTDGDKVVIVPSISNEDAAEKFPKGFTEIKPYLRLTPQPNR